MRGNVDLIADDMIEGWIVDDVGNQTDLCVIVLIDGVEVNRGYPYLSRHDLIEAGLGETGFFRIPFNSLHHHNIAGHVQLIELNTGYSIPPGPIKFQPVRQALEALDVRDVEDRLTSGINARIDVSSLNQDIQIISKLLGSAVDRAFALADHTKASAASFRDALERFGGLGGALGHMIGVIQQNYQPIVIPYNKNPVVSIIIPVHNKFSLTYQCLTSILNSPQDSTYEILIVDDLSNDETILSSLVFFGSVQILRNKANEGFVGSCNEGARKARGRYLYFLNNDTIVEGRWLDALVATLADENIGIAGSRLLFADRSLQECGGIVWQDGSAWNWGRGESPDDPRFKFMRSADYVSGAALMIATKDFQALGGFDERYKPAYYEDTDLCFQMRARGRRVVVQPASTIIHLEGQSNGTNLLTGLKKYQSINHHKFIQKWKSILVNHRPNAVEPDLEANRDAKRRVLFIDDTVPTPDQDAGSNAALEHMKSLMRLGFHVVFVPSDNMSSISPYTDQLEELGIECIYVPYFWSLEDYLRRVPCEFEVVYLHRFSNANRSLEFIRKMRPLSYIVYNIADLHYLREKRGEEIGKPAGTTPGRAKGDRELELIGLADATIVHSTHEKEVLDAKQEDLNVHLVRWPLTVNRQNVDFTARHGIAFIGGYRHLPNVDAAEWLCNIILPSLWEQHEIGVELIGSNMPNNLMLRKDDGLTVTGFVPNLPQKIASLRLTVAPLRYGAGLKGKVLSSFACGTPCVMTPVASEGMNLPDELAVYVSDQPQEIIDMIVSLSSDRSRWEKASQACIAYIQDEYSELTIDQQMKGAISRYNDRDFTDR